MSNSDAAIRCDKFISTKWKELCNIICKWGCYKWEIWKICMDMTYFVRKRQDTLVKVESVCN